MNSRSGRFVGLLLPILLSGLSSGLAQEPQEKGYRPGRTMVRTRAISLDELTARAKTIFYGEVTDVKTEAKDLGGKSLEEVRRVYFKVLQSYKGDLKPGDPIDYLLSPLLDAEIAKGDKLLWYLPDVSISGLIAPIGLHSGFFRALPKDKLEPGSPKDEGKPKLFIVNLKSNEGLFPKESPGITPAEVKVAEGMTAGVSDSKELQGYADRSGGAQPLPFELLIAATQKRLPPKK